MLKTLRKAGTDQFFSLWICRGGSSNYEIVAWSEGAAKLYGLPREYVLGKSICIFVSEPEQPDALSTTDDTIEAGTLQPNWLNRDVRSDGSPVLTLTQGLRIWNPFDREYQFGEIGLDVSDIFESEHALFERRNERQLSVNEMMRLSVLNRALAQTRSLRTLNDVTRIVADALASILLQDCSVAVWLVRRDDQTPLPLATAGDRRLPLPTADLVYREGRLRGDPHPPQILAIRPLGAEHDVRIAVMSVVLSPTEAVVVSLTVQDRSHTDRSDIFLESLMEACAAAIHQWLFYSDVDGVHPGDAGGSRYALVEATLVASELSHIAKNRLTTIQNIVFLLRQWAASEGATTRELIGHLDQLESEVTDAAAQLLYAQSGLSVANVMVSQLVEQVIRRAAPTMAQYVTVRVEPADLRLNGPTFNFDTILGNLLRNACDAVSTAASSPSILIVVSELLEAEVRSCLLEVHDNGSGVQEHAVSTIFTGVTTKGAGHSGQGLPNAFRAVQAVGGRVWLPERSPQLGGALFRVAYPL